LINSTEKIMDYNKIKIMGINLELGGNSQGLNYVLMEKCIAKDNWQNLFNLLSKSSHKS